MGRRVVARGVAALLAVATAAIGQAGAQEPPPPEGTFTALTYNVAGLPVGLSGSEPDVNTPLISPLLNAYDLVLVQEDWIDPDPPIGFDFFHDDLISAVTHPYLSTPAPPPLGTNPARPTALVADGLNRLSRFPFGPITRVMWPNCFGGIDTSDGGAADCLSEKGFSVATTELAPGVEVDVYNLHAEAGNTVLDRQYSAEDFALLAAFIQTHSAGRAVIVAGDYNLHTDRAGDGAVHRRFLHEAGLTDVCEVVDCGSDLHRIDKFAFRGGDGIVLQALSHRFERDVFVRESDGAPLSDHDALAVTFAWRVDPDAVGSVRGTVTGPDGEPVESALVLLYLPGDVWIGSRWAVTDAEGRYEIDDVPAGTHAVGIAGPAGSGLVPAWLGATVTPAGTTPGIDAELAEGGALAGTVTGPDGPVGGAIVRAFDADDLWVPTSSIRTAPDGRFRLEGLPAGEYEVYVAAPAASGLASQWHGDRQPVLVTAGATTGGVDTHLGPP